MIICFFLQACQHVEHHDALTDKKADLNKAASYNMQLGLGYLKQGDRARAKKKLLIAYEQAPNSSDVNAAMAYYFEQTKEIEQAQKYYLNAISLSSQAGAQLNNYGAFLCRQGDYKKAELYFLQAVKDVRYIHTSGAYENAGLCALAIPDVNKAKLYFMKALNQDPSRRESFYELITLETKMGHYRNAYLLLQKYPDLVSNNKSMILLAKKIAKKVGKNHVAGQYEPNIDNSGANNEYNSRNG